MLFVQRQDVVIRLKLYEIGCMMRHFIPDVHGEVHIWHLDTMQHGTDGPQHAEWTHKNWHQVLFIDECRMCLQPDNRRRHGQAEHLRHTVQQVQQGGGSLMFWGGIMWCWRMPQVVMEGAEMAIRYMNDILRPILLSYRQNFWEELVLMDDNSHPHRAHLVNVFLHGNNIARLEWPACFQTWTLSTMPGIYRDDPPTTLRDLRQFAAEE